MRDENLNDDPLMRSLRKLPGAIEPRSDLWAGIAAGIEAEQAKQQPAPSRNRWNLGIGLAAGFIGIAVGGVLAYVVMSRSAALHESGVAQQSSIEQPAIQNAAHLDTPPQMKLIPAAFGPDYVRERDAVLARLNRQLQALAPADQTKVKLALRDIDAGLTALNEALAKSPDSILLQQLVLSAYQRQLQTLQDIAETTANPNAESRT